MHDLPMENIKEPGLPYILYKYQLPAAYVRFYRIIRRGRIQACRRNHILKGLYFKEHISSHQEYNI